MFVNNDKSKIYGTDSRYLLSLDIQNWRKNRPPDISRISDIIKTLKKQDYLDGFIYLFSKNGEEGPYYCYDGIHRFLALKKLHEEDPGYNHRIFVHLYDNYDEENIENKFKQINKCVPVPEIYTESSLNLDIKTKVEFVVKKCYKKYRKHFSPSKRPSRPNENRDKMMDKITDFIRDNNLNYKFTKEKLYKICVEDLNQIMKSKYFEHSKLTSKQREKCIYNNCYLFILKDWEKVLNIILSEHKIA